MQIVARESGKVSEIISVIEGIAFRTNILALSAAVEAVQVTVAGERMLKIVESTTRVSDIMGEIAAASQDQSRGMAEVSRVISQMDQITQQDSSLVEEAVVASASRDDQEAQLRIKGGIFKLEEVELLAGFSFGQTSINSG